MGGVERAVSTDLGFWSIELTGFVVYSREQRKTWNAIRQDLNGKAGYVAVPAWSFDTAPYVSGEREFPTEVEHDDDSLLDDDTAYLQAAISVVSVGATPIGATIIKMRVINADSDLSGSRFSYAHALYEAGPVIETDGDIYTFPISPSVRALIPDGSDLEFDMPTCMCRLADDRGMDAGVDPSEIEQRSVQFEEAVDYWKLLALEGAG